MRNRQQAMNRPENANRTYRRRKRLRLPKVGVEPEVRVLFAAVGRNLESVAIQASVIR
jgi:hypothetical protein